MNSWFVSGGQLATCGFGGHYLSLRLAILYPDGMKTGICRRVIKLVYQVSRGIVCLGAAQVMRML